MRDGLFFGHPRGLVVLFGSAAGEMFAVFGMRSVLIYYLTQDARMNDALAVQVYSLSGAAIFLTGLLGGYVADRVLGIRRAGVAGALIMAVGLLSLMSPSLLYLGLGLIALGNGLYKPSMWTQVGLLYSNTDSRRERGYVIFHVGCNLGAVAAPFLCGWLGEAYGWKWAFLCAGVAMLGAALVLVIGQRRLTQAREAPEISKSAGASDELRANLWLLIVAWISASLFWTAYSQIGSTFALWVEHSVARTVGVGPAAFTIPAAWFQAINPALVFVLAPLVNLWWRGDRARTGVRRDLGKMALGAGVLALTFVVLALASAGAGPAGKVNPLWVALAIAPYTLAELTLPPVAMALYTRLSPARLATVFVSILFLTQMMGNVAAGFMGALWVRMNPAGFFAVTAGVAFASAAVLLAARVAAGGRIGAARAAQVEV